MLPDRVPVYSSRGAVRGLDLTEQLVGSVDHGASNTGFRISAARVKSALATILGGRRADQCYIPIL
jgi:hypothetical protein